MKLHSSSFLSLLLLLLLFSLTATATQQINIGFTANPDPSSSPFQPLLSDPSGVFALGFLQTDSSSRLLDLAVLHLPSSLPVWRATPARPARWAASTSLSFNGTTLSLSDPETGLLWSIRGGGGDGDHLVLLDSSNLQLRTPTNSILWQSFNYPSDTLLENQNLTSKSALVSTNQRYTMKLGPSSLGLRMDPGPPYWRHTAMEAKAQIVAGEGDVYARVDPLGFLGMYQSEAALVDVLAFNTFNRGIPGLRRLTLERDGNLRAYYWNANATRWVLDFTAIADPCSLPSTCGPYGLCRAGGGDGACGCLDGRADGCSAGDGDHDGGDLCIGEGEYWVVRRKGVDLANKEMLGSAKMGSLEECEAGCERNCSCWGAVYNNATGFCYGMDYPAVMVVAEGNEGKVGYFKVRASGEMGGEGDKAGGRLGRATMAVGVVVFAGAAVFGAYRVWMEGRRRKGVEGSMTEGTYKDLSCSSFRSIELCNSFRR